MNKLYFSIIVMSNNEKSVEIFVREKISDLESYKKDEMFTKKIGLFGAPSLINVDIKVYECDKKATGIPDYDFLEARYRRDYRFIKECREIDHREFTIEK